MDEDYEPVTRWRNIGVFGSTNVMPYAGIATPWGNLIFKRWEDRLFSERYGHRKGLKIGWLFITWVRLRRLRNMPEPF